MPPQHHEDSYVEPRDAAGRQRSVGEHAFIWLAWALAAAFWGATMTTMFGILQSVSAGAPAAGGSGLGGAGWLMFGGLLLLGAAIAYGSWMYSHRDRRLDPVGEVATAAQYDRADRPGGRA